MVGVVYLLCRMWNRKGWLTGIKLNPDIVPTYITFYANISKNRKTRMKVLKFTIQLLLVLKFCCLKNAKTLIKNPWVPSELYLGIGEQNRTRKVVTQLPNHYKNHQIRIEVKTLIENQRCRGSGQSCQPVQPRSTEWSDWSSCQCGSPSGFQNRTMKIITNDGRATYEQTLMTVRGCECNQNPWSRWSRCRGGAQHRFRRDAVF